MNTKQADYARKWREAHPGYRTKQRKDRNMILSKNGKNKHLLRVPDISTCDILKKHHETLKGDPERLSTEFIKKLINNDICPDYDKEIK